MEWAPSSKRGKTRLAHIYDYHRSATSTRQEQEQAASAVEDMMAR